MSISLKKSNLNNSTDSIASSLASTRKNPTQSRMQSKKRTSKDHISISESIKETIIKKQQPLANNYCINIYVDGGHSMDRVSHLGVDQIGGLNASLEHRMRPVSGVRNHLRRNLATHQADFDILKETDLIDRISTLKSLKRLDLSNNKLRKFPLKLCDLDLSILNLTNNQLDDLELPNEKGKFQNLIELTLDSNKFKNMPKSIR